MSDVKQMPIAVQIRSPEAIRRIVKSVEAGTFRNYSEAAEVLIIEASERRKHEATEESRPRPAA